MKISMLLFLVIALCGNGQTATSKRLLNQNSGRKGSVYGEHIPRGRLGQPVGDLLSIKGKFMDVAQSRGMLFRVDAVNGKRLPRPIEMLIEGASPTKDKVATIRGYESLRMVGTPPALRSIVSANTKNGTRLKSHWQLQTYFVVVPMVSTPTGKNGGEKTSQANGLSAEQRQAIESINREAMQKAAPVALKMEATARKIYQNMLADHPDDNLRQSLAEDLSGITNQLLTIKGGSIRDAVGILTKEQKLIIQSEMVKPGAPGDLSEIIAKKFGLEQK